MLLQVDGCWSCLVPWNFALQLWFMLFCYELILLVLWGEKFSDKLQWLKWMTNMMYIILTTKYNVAKYKMHVTYWRKLNCQHPSSKDIPGQSAGGKLSHNILANMYQRNLINEENNVACQKLDICRTGMCGCINKGATILVKALICLCCKQPRLAILPMSMSPLLKSFESNV